MNFLFNYYVMKFSQDKSHCPGFNSFYKVDNECKKIQVDSEFYSIEFSLKKDQEKHWTEFWKLFLANLKLLMSYQEKKEELELTGLIVRPKIEEWKIDIIICVIYS